MTPEALIMESMFMVPTKEGEDVNFRLNNEQRQLDNNLTGRDLIPKARQMGVSTYFLGRYLAVCLSKRNRRAVIVSHERESTERLLYRVRYFIENIRGPKPVTEHLSKSEITFPKTGSMFYIGTAGSRKFGRGDTITHLHCSEYAYWMNSKTLLGGLLDAVPMSGEVALESTGNGVGNDYHSRCIRASGARGGWRLHFLNWLDFGEYSLDLSKKETDWLMANLDENLGEPALSSILTPGQLAWRRLKLEEKEFDIPLFEQEYPITLEQCFQASGRSIFYKVLYEQTDKWIQQDKDLHVLDPHPIRGKIYSIGADVSAGVGKDNAAIQVICVNPTDGGPMEQVATWAHNRVGPDVLAGKIADLGRLFNDAYVTVENNNHGIVTLYELQNLYDSYLIFESGSSAGAPSSDDAELYRLGHRTTSRTKPLMIGKLRTALAKDIITHDPLTRGELSTFVETETGSLEAEEGCMDDRVMAYACCVLGMERAAIYASPEEAAADRRKLTPSPFSMEAIIKELRQGNDQYPIKPQHESTRR